MRDGRAACNYDIILCFEWRDKMLSKHAYTFTELRPGILRQTIGG